MQNKTNRRSTGPTPTGVSSPSGPAVPAPRIKIPSKRRGKYTAYYVALGVLGVAVLALLVCYPYILKSLEPRKPKPPPAELPLSFPAVEKLLGEIYPKRLGYHLEEREKKFISKEGGDPTYGEILVPTGEHLLMDIFNVSHRSVVYDFGSGTGKFILQTGLATNVSKAVGIELSPTRNNMALNAYRKLQERNTIPENDARIQLVEGNFLLFNISDATDIYMCSTCYHDGLMDGIYHQIMNYGQPGLKVITLVNFNITDPYQYRPKRLEFQTIHRLRMSWSDTSPGHYYIMRDDADVHRAAAAQASLTDGQHAEL